jgi:predicted nucleotidyltransferase
MSNLRSLNKIKEELGFCKDYWTVLYGSYLTEEFIPDRSDIDIAIITKNRDKQSNLGVWRCFLEQVSAHYDLRIFELLPLYFQIEIIKNYRVVFGDSLEISEYFYRYRSIWKDMVVRIKANQFYSIQEKLDLITRRARFLK